MTLTAALADLDAAVTLAELERAVIAAEAEAGWNVHNARRPLTAAEFAAGVKFGPIQRRYDRLAEALVVAVEPVAEAVLAWLPDALAGLTPRQAADALSRMASPTTPLPAPGLDDASATARAAVERTLRQAWQEACGDVLTEARHQGAKHLPAEPAPITPAAADVIDAATDRLVGHRVARVLAVAEATARAWRPPAAASGVALSAMTIVDAIRAAVVGAGQAGTADIGRQTIYQVNSAARVAEVTEPGMPPIREVYASELLDSKTCGPCAAVDGTTFADLSEALTYYEELGGYLDCEGGPRCRGMLIFTLATEQAPTVDDVERQDPEGPGPGPGPTEPPPPPEPPPAPEPPAPPVPAEPDLVAQPWVRLSDDEVVARRITRDNAVHDPNPDAAMVAKRISAVEQRIADIEADLVHSRSYLVDTDDYIARMKAEGAKARAAAKARGASAAEQRDAGQYWTNEVRRSNGNRARWVARQADLQARQDTQREVLRWVRSTGSNPSVVEVALRQARLHEVHASGPHTVQVARSVRQQFSDGQVSDLLRAFDESRAAQPMWRRVTTTGRERGYTIIVDESAEQTGAWGYTYLGHDQVWINPEVVLRGYKPTFDDVAPGGVKTSHTYTSSRGPLRDVIDHEFGHTMDTAGNTPFTPTLGTTSASKPRQVSAPSLAVYEHVKADPYLWGLLSPYGRVNPSEAYAETYLRWVIKGRGADDPLARVYADVFGWETPLSDYAGAWKGVERDAW